jgi:hypothetical protein
MSRNVFASVLRGHEVDNQAFDRAAAHGASPLTVTPADKRLVNPLARAAFFSAMVRCNNARLRGTEIIIFTNTRRQFNFGFDIRQN